MATELKRVIMQRDDLTSEEADKQISDAQELVLAGRGPEEVLSEEFGLEPDYIFDLLEGI